MANPRKPARRRARPAPAKTGANAASKQPARTNTGKQASVDADPADGDFAKADDTVVRVRGMAFSRGSRKIFDGIDLDIRRGKVTAIMGPSGTGKTTLLKLIGGQLRPEAGQVTINGKDVHALPRSELFQLRKHIGMLFQSGALLTDINVYDNVAFPLREHTNLSEQLIHHLVLMKLQAVGLRSARELMPSELSGGMSRRVALARAIALDPTMVLYDEPFTGQDPISMGVIVQLIRRLNDATGLTSVVVSHDVAETLGIADYAYVLSGGRVVAEGTPQQLADSQDPWVRQFVDGLADGPVPFHYPGCAIADDFLQHCDDDRSLSGAGS